MYSAVFICAVRMYILHKTSSNARTLTHTPAGIWRKQRMPATTRMVHSFSRQLCVPVGLNRPVLCAVCRAVYVISQTQSHFTLMPNEKSTNCTQGTAVHINAVQRLCVCHAVRPATVYMLNMSFNVKRYFILSPRHLCMQ